LSLGYPHSSQIFLVRHTFINRALYGVIAAIRLGQNLRFKFMLKANLLAYFVIVRSENFINMVTDWVLPLPSQQFLDAQSFDRVLHEGTDGFGDFGTPTTLSQRNYF
jgi:cytoplasmic iron level regulating protein YaaA (DUF328/UPF0246 family)